METGQGCKKLLSTHCSIYTQLRGNPTSGAAVALVQSFFADAALGALRTAHGTTGAAAFLAGGAFALFAFARPGAGAGSICGTGAVGVHDEWRRRLKTVRERSWRARRRRDL